MAYTPFPDSAICYILADIPGEGEYQATGVIIGPHTILTVSHELWDAGYGAADGVSVYPGFVPNGTTYNPPGALPDTQAIHYIKVPDGGGVLGPRGTQHDFAVIDTSANLSPYGHFALNFGFKSGDTVLKGYPASNGGHLTGVETNVSADAVYSDLDTQNLPISPGYSGGPIYDTVPNGRGQIVDAVTGLVSTGNYAMKLNLKKLGIIENWVSSDSGLWTGQGSPSGAITPQLAGTVDSATLAASLAATADPIGFYTAAAPLNHDSYGGEFATMVDVLHDTRTVGDETRLVPGTDSNGFAALLGSDDRRPPSHATGSWG